MTYFELESCYSLFRDIHGITSIGEPLIVTMKDGSTRRVGLGFRPYVPPIWTFHYRGDPTTFSAFAFKEDGSLDAPISIPLADIQDIDLEVAIEERKNWPRDWRQLDLGFEYPDLDAEYITAAYVTLYSEKPLIIWKPLL